MNRNYFFGIVIVALCSLLLVFFSLWRAIETPIVKEPINPPPAAPYRSYIFGVGIVEPSSENIFIGTPTHRLVEKIFVTVGAEVKKGDPLFSLENRDLKATLMVREAAYKGALAKLHRLEAMPRAEDLALAQAALNSAHVELELAKKQYEMVQELPDQRAISFEEKHRRLSSYRQTLAKWQQADVNFNKIKEGAWKQDLEVARQEVLQEEANVDMIKTELQRTLIQAPIDGTVLQIKIHEGEIPIQDTFRVPIIVLGDIGAMNLRVSINQLDIPYFHANTPAVAFLQGDSRVEFPLEFVRVEPLLVNKQNLTNQINEKVDTKVLQIIYRLKQGHNQVFVGQQMDVFIKEKQS